MELIGYGPNSPLALPSAILEWLEAKEESLGLPLIIETVPLGVPIPRTESHDAREAFKIYDIATPGERINTFNQDYVYFRKPGDDPHVQGLRHMSFQRRTSIRYSADNYELAKLGTENECQWFNMFDYRTIWTRWALNNIMAMPGHGMSLADSMKLFLGDWMDAAMDREFFESREERIRDAALQAFLDYVKSATGSKITTIKRNMASTESSIASLDQQKASYSVQLKEQFRELQHAESMQVYDQKGFETNFKELTENTKFESVSYDSNEGCLVMKTKLLYLHSPNMKERVELGLMKINFFISTRAIKIFNLTNPQGGRHHPHIPNEGDPCWGGIAVVVVNLARDGELVALAEQILAFLETYNPDDGWATYASYWWSAQGKRNIEYLQSDGSYKTTAQIEQEEKADATSAEDLLDEMMIEEEVVVES